MQNIKNIVGTTAGITGFGTALYVVISMSRKESDQLNMSSIHDPESKLRKMAIDQSVPRFMEKIAARENCKEHYDAFKECATKVNETFGNLSQKVSRENAVLSQKMIKYCKWAGENQHLCLHEAYFDSELYFKGKKEYLEYTEVWKQTKVKKAQRDYIDEAVRDERPTDPFVSIPDEPSRQYFFDSVVRNGKQEFYSRFKELVPHIEKAEARMAERERNKKSIEEIYPNEKFAPYFHNTKSNLAKEKPQYFKKQKELYT